MKTDNTTRRDLAAKLAKELEKAANQVRNSTDHYATLGANLGTTSEQLKVMHRTLMRKLHPDVCTLPDAHDLSAKVNVAYATLSDPRKRRAYNRDNKVDTRACSTCAGTGQIKKQKGIKKVSMVCPDCGGTGQHG
jgi:DnaJ-class molecular chaperone